MKHNKRNWNHFIGIETYTIMSKAQQMVQYDHEVLPPPVWTIEGKKKGRKNEKEDVRKRRRKKKRRRKIRQDGGREIAWISEKSIKKKGFDIPIRDALFSEAE